MNPIAFCCRLFRLPGPVLGLLVALAVLQGCGPTGGGTGTGGAAVTLADFGATAASSCSAAFATALDCTTVSDTPTATAQLPGTAAVVFVGNSASGPFTMTLQGNHVDLQSRCQATHFEGDWGQLPGGEARYFGSFQGPGAAAATAAMLWVQALPGSDGALQVLVQDVQGRALFGPLQLQRVATAPTEPPACP